MKEKSPIRSNFIILMLFSMILLISSIAYNIYSVGTRNKIKKELDEFANSLSLRMQSKYIDMISIYFNDEYNNYAIANEFTNLVKEQVELAITPHFNSIKFSVDYTMKNNIKNTTYFILFIAVLIFILALALNFTNNNITSYNNINHKVHIDNNNDNNQINNIINTKSSDNIRIKIEEMYKSLINEIKNLREDNALAIIENMFQLDDRNYLALNGAGILYTKMYSKYNKEENFKKANQYFEYSISLYNYSENIYNNKAILYSIKYELNKIEEYYKNSLILFNNALSSNNFDTELLNNRATLYLVKYKMNGDENLFNRSLSDYNEVIEIDFNNVYALNNRSALYFHKYKVSGDKKYFYKSIEDCNTAFKINSSEVLYDNRGTLYIYKF